MKLSRIARLIYEESKVLPGKISFLIIGVGCCTPLCPPRTSPLIILSVILLDKATCICVLEKFINLLQLGSIGCYYNPMVVEKYELEVDQRFLSKTSLVIAFIFL